MKLSKKERESIAIKRRSKRRLCEELIQAVRETVAAAPLDSMWQQELGISRGTHAGWKRMAEEGEPLAEAYMQAIQDGKALYARMRLMEPAAKKDPMGMLRLVLPEDTSETTTIVLDERVGQMGAPELRRELAAALVAMPAEEREWIFGEVRAQLEEMELELVEVEE